MAYIEWDGKYSVNVAEIDDQHKRLFELVNDLLEALKVGRGKDVLVNIFARLMDYTIIHFNTEEKYFNMFDFEGAASHKKEHKEFKTKISELRKNFEDDVPLVSVEVMDYLVDWVTQHVTGTDREYIKCFNDNGLR